jgi:prophage regulatory protein
MAERPTFRLMGAQEIGKRLGGVSRERVYQITQRRTFPEPYQRLAMGFVWLEVDVEAWIAKNRPELAGDGDADE